MHPEILNNEQRELLPLLSKFKNEYYMVGGTAIALHIGHRLSIDFDLFKNGTVNPKKVINLFKDKKEDIIVTLNRDGQLNLVCRNVKFTFFNFEYSISKWKDYLDLYFIIKDHYNINLISNKATEYFGDLFSEKLFRGQLNYFEGISFEEQVEFMPGFEVDGTAVKEFLTDAALTGF